MESGMAYCIPRDTITQPKNRRAAKRACLKSLFCHAPPKVPQRELGFTTPPRIASSAPVMDVFWSIFAMPIGVALVLGPAALVWWLVDRKHPAPDHKDSPFRD